MGTLSLERVNRLLWLGRYVERCQTTLAFILSTYDAALDSLDTAEGNWKGQLEELGFNQDDHDADEFFRACLFDPELQTSVKHSLDAAFDNVIVLRNIIGTESAAYIHLASMELSQAQTSDAPLLDLQAVTDYLMAFKGACDDYIAAEQTRNIVRCGMAIERMDLYVRLAYRLEDVPKEVQKLATRIDRTGLPYNRDAFKAIIEQVYSPEYPENTTYETLGILLQRIGEVFA